LDSRYARLIGTIRVPIDGYMKADAEKAVAKLKEAGATTEMK